MDFSGIEKFSLLDFDTKVSCVLFVQNCNFRCPFCHNGPLVLNHNNLTIPWNDILSFLNKRKGILDAVVISGGEPTLMPDLKDKIIEIKKLGYLVKLDTNGTNPKVVKDLVEAKLVDYVAVDIKNSLDRYHQTIDSKICLDPVIETIEYLKTDVVDYEFRTTLVKEFHEEKDIRDMIPLIKGAKRLFLQKFIDREGCISRELHEVNKIDAMVYQNILKPYVGSVELRGY